MSLQLSEADLHNQDILAKKLITLAEIVVRKHFYVSVNEKEDLVSVGVLKALSMINSGTFSESKGNFATFIYTGMRNDMHNYLYHQNKFNTIDIEEMVDEGRDDNYFQNREYLIEYSLIHSVCMQFSRAFGDSLEYHLIKQMALDGYTIIGIKKDRSIIVGENDILLDRYSDEVKDDIIDRLIGIILWKKREHSMSDF